MDFDEANPVRYFTYGVACAEVEIDVSTGQHEVTEIS